MRLHRGTARRLGAVVTGYDVRPGARAEVLSVGGRFLQLGAPVEAAGAGGYARELTAAERQDQQRALDSRIPAFDVVITTAAVPGRRPPLLVTEEALAGMRAGQWPWTPRPGRWAATSRGPGPERPSPSRERSHLPGLLGS